MDERFAVRDLEPHEMPVWNALATTAPEGSSYVTSQYLKLLAEVTGATARIIGVFRGHELVGGMGLYQTPLGGRGQVQTSGRYLLYYNGPCVKPSTAESSYRCERHRTHVLEAIEQFLRQAYRQARFKARSPASDYRAFIGSGWLARPVYSYELDLTDLPQLWARMDHNLRRLIGRCRTDGMRLQDEGDFSEFYDAHQSLHARKGTPLYLPRCSFSRFVDGLLTSELGRLFAVLDSSGKAIAWQLVLLGAHPVSHTLAANALESHQASGCNAFLRWQVCEWLAARGFRANDLTDAHQPEVARFKSQLGAQLKLGLQIELPPTAAAALGSAAKSFARSCVKRAWR
jgi:hypothetical protein